MFAVVRTGGKQYRVHPGDKIVVEKLDGNAGDKIKLGDVLLAGEGSDFRNTDGLIVDAEIVAQAKGEKVTVFKKRRRHNYRRKKGHRQQHTILKIVAIGGAKKAAKEAAETASQAPNAVPENRPQTKGKSKAAAAAEANAAPAQVTSTPTENPAPDNEAQANPPAQSTDAPPKAAKDKPVDKPTAKTASTKNAAPAKGAAKKSPKGK